MKFTQILKAIPVFLMAATISITACSGDNGADGVNGTDGVNGVDGKDGKDGKNATEVNVDSLAQILREEITGTLWDSLYAEPYVDTVYQILFDNAFADAWMDSVREALVDSLLEADFDSLYGKLYDSVYNDIYTQSVIRTLDASLWTYKENIYGAFANQYSLMYKDFKNSNGELYPIPVSIYTRNTCEKGSKVPCRWKKIEFRTWIEDFTDTSSVTEIVNPDDAKVIAANLTFNKEKLLKLTTPEQSQIQVRAYALENDREILFFSKSAAVTIHPMQTNGGELKGVKNRSMWDAVWVTPNMDSIPDLLDEIAATLPDTLLLAYQLYSEDETIAQSSERVVDAVFKVLQKRGIKYIENNGSGSTAQKINYPIEVLRSKQAVCNEYSFLFASILEAIGFDVVLVKTTTHMFVGWKADKSADNTYGFVETTLLTYPDATFDQAYNSAVEKYNSEVEAGNFESGDTEIISIKDARKYGIMPNDIP
ncbi:MAG: hypothetical protein MJY82_09450 [Fibrobacter sp.]|nr:hypothetical protein [Fibrobacter sp.]